MASALTPAGSTRRWRRIRLLVLTRDGYRCQLPADDGAGLCGAFASHVDHLLPRSQGGADVPANLRAACAPHNLRRGAGRQGSVDSKPRRSVGWRW